MDFLLTSAPHYLPSRLYSVYPHPAQDPSEKRKYIVMLTSRHAAICLLVLSLYLISSSETRMSLGRSLGTCTPNRGAHSTVLYPLFRRAVP
jgi:hypothetical protein